MPSESHGDRPAVATRKPPNGATSPHAPSTQAGPPILNDGTGCAPQQPLLNEIVIEHKTKMPGTRPGMTSFRARGCSPPPYFFSIFQNTGVAGPSRTPDSLVLQPLGTRYWPSGM